MECHECRGRLLDYVAKLLRDRDRMELTQHLKHCPDCRQVLDKLKRDREKLNEWRCDSPKPGLADRTVLHALLAAENRRRRLGWGKWVAAVVAVWCVCSGYRNLRSPRVSSSSTARPALRPMPRPRCESCSDVTGARNPYVTPVSRFGWLPRTDARRIGWGRFERTEPDQ